VQIEVSVATPVLRVTVIVFTDTSEFSDVDAPNILFDASLNDVCREAVEEVGSTL